MHDNVTFFKAGFDLKASPTADPTVTKCPACYRNFSVQRGNHRFCPTCRNRKPQTRTGFERRPE